MKTKLKKSKNKPKRIVRYGLLCLNCRDLIYSRFRHDFRKCECGGIFIDGGGDYMRYGCEKDVKFESVRLLLPNVF